MNGASSPGKQGIQNLINRWESINNENSAIAQSTTNGGINQDTKLAHPKYGARIRRSQSLSELNKNGFHEATQRSFQDVARTANNLQLDHKQVDRTPERRRAGTQFTPNKELPPTPPERRATEVDSPRTKRNIIDAIRKFPFVSSKKEKVEKEKEIQRSPRFQNKIQMKPPSKNQKIKESAQECENTLQSLSGLVSIMHGYSSRGELTLSFPLANTISNLNSSLKDLKRKALLDFYKILFLTNTDLLDDLPQNQEKRIEEFTRKIIEFIDKIEKLKESLEENDVFIMDESSKTKIDKEPFINAMASFNEKHGQRFQNLLSNFHIALQTDEESSQKVFEEIKKFLESLNKLTESYIKYFGYKGLTVSQKGVPYRIKLDEDRYGKSDTRDATDFLISIPREISQYEDLLSKHLIKNAHAIAEFVEQKRLPFPSAKNASNFDELLILLRKLHGDIMGHDSLFAPLNLFNPSEIDKAKAL